ncbi:hypothetical protein CEXT_209051 [Caerostris extrusa]|uniref:Uncharacterized protein n=1 Tax=Caerostris extrusa TaxID=172846 RepID=A0AAV4MJB0_CAEEX|nr:hypothetical protein CEXT_209051 [Caerostris extrusa]
MRKVGKVEVPFRIDNAKNKGLAETKKNESEKQKKKKVEKKRYCFSPTFPFSFLDCSWWNTPFYFSFFFLQVFFSEGRYLVLLEYLGQWGGRKGRPSWDVDQITGQNGQHLQFQIRLFLVTCVGLAESFGARRAFSRSAGVSGAMGVREGRPSWDVDQITGQDGQHLQFQIRLFLVTCVSAEESFGAFRSFLFRRRALSRSAGVSVAMGGAREGRPSWDVDQITGQDGQHLQFQIRLFLVTCVTA